MERTQLLVVVVVLSGTLVTVWGKDQEKPNTDCNCGQTRLPYIPQYGYNFPHFGHNDPTSNENTASEEAKFKSTNQQQHPHFMPHPGVYVPNPIYMLPQWPVPQGVAVKGEKGEPGERVTDCTQCQGGVPPMIIKEGQLNTPERDPPVDPNKDSDGNLCLKGDKGDRGLTGPHGYRGEPGPPGPPAAYSHKMTGNIQLDGVQQDGQAGEEGKDKRGKVAFTVALTKNLGPTSEPLTLNFEEVTTNLGEAYNTESGEFFAPVSGLYVFDYHILGQHSKPTEVALKHNNKIVNTVHSRETGGYTGVSNTAILALAKGDIVTLVLSPGIYYVYGATGHHTTFSGYLLYPD